MQAHYDSRGGVPTVFDYPDIPHFLCDLLARKQTRNPRYSIRAWSRQLGLNSPSLLLNVLKGERRLNPTLGAKIARHVKFTPEEKKYFDTLVLAGLARTDEEKELYSRILNRLQPDKERSELKLAHFGFINDWHYLAILELFALRDFRPDASYISRRLREKISLRTVELALRRLQQLGLIGKNSKAELVRLSGNPVVKDEIPDKAVQSHHTQMMEQAKCALEEQTVEERDFRATKLPIRKADFAAAKELIKEFHRALQKLSSKADGDEVYAFNTQFFKLTWEVEK